MEKNRDIFDKALNNLPNHKADPNIWGGLSTSLENLDATRFIQNNKANLPAHKAPVTAWKGIEQGLKASFWTGTSGLLIKIGSVVLITTAVVTAILFTKTPAEIHESAINKNAQKEQEGISEEPVKQAPQKENTFNKPAHNTGGPSSANPGAPLQPTESNVASNQANKAGRAIPSEWDAEKRSKENTESVGFSDLGWLPRLGTTQNIRFPDTESRSKRIHFMQASEKYRVRNDYYREKRRFDISLGGSYAWARYLKLNLEDMEIPESVSSVGMDILFEKDRFYLKTGWSYTSWEESAPYAFRYNKNEVVYEYLYVDSASYLPGTNTLVYHTTEQEVYDSVYYEKPDAIRSRYKVLQVPLIFGYKVMESRKWMIGFNVGVGADINIGKNVVTPVFNESQSSLVGVENHMVYRSAINWRLLAGAGVFYRFSNRLSIFVEPDFNIYLNTVYPGTELNNISYFDLRFGILYKF